MNQMIVNIMENVLVENDLQSANKVAALDDLGESAGDDDHGKTVQQSEDIVVGTSSIYAISIKGNLFLNLFKYRSFFFQLFYPTNFRAALLVLKPAPSHLKVLQLAGSVDVNQLKVRNQQAMLPMNAMKRWRKKVTFLYLAKNNNSRGEIIFLLH